MLILIDLDGTIYDSVDPSWKPFKDGLKNKYVYLCLNDKYFYTGAKEFIQTQKEKGNSILIVSDSHPGYVEPISNYIGCDCVSLAAKPNKTRLSAYLDEHPTYKAMVESKDCMFIGDTVLDIELGRSLSIPTIWFVPYKITAKITNEVDKVGDEMACIKMGPTFVAKSFDEINSIIDDPINNLYSIESSFAGGNSLKTIKYGQNRFVDGSYAAIRCLARQEAGVCDKYARADKYYLIANPNRSEELISSIAKGISSYINQSTLKQQNWDFITYLTDKETTIPRNKMKEIFDLVETDIPKIQLFTWSDSVQGSLRDRFFYADRKNFLENNLHVDAADISKVDNEEKVFDDRLDIRNKNIIVIDDQLTTSATAWFSIHKLKEKGAHNVLFIALFQMALRVESEVLCPNCGKRMDIKIRYSDGQKFYSCTPPKYKGEGCGYTLNYSENDEHLTRYLRIVKKYQSAFKTFIKGRNMECSNMLQFIIDSEEKIKLISEMETYELEYISDQDIEDLYQLRKKGQELLYNDPYRKNTWLKWASNCMENLPKKSYRDILSYTLQHIKELDEYIQNNQYEN